MLINKSLSFIDKKTITVLYLNYKYFFFEGISREWFLQIVNNGKILNMDNRAKDFVRYLTKNNILISSLGELDKWKKVRNLSK